jgi:hypothetical protein
MWLDTETSEGEVLAVGVVALQKNTKGRRPGKRSAD